MLTIIAGVNSLKKQSQALAATVTQISWDIQKLHDELFNTKIFNHQLVSVPVTMWHIIWMRNQFLMLELKLEVK